MVRQMLPPGSAESLPVGPYDQWDAVGREWNADTRTPHSELAARCLVRFYSEGFGGNRLPGTEPAPVPRTLWQQAKRRTFNAQGVSMQLVDAC